MPSCCLASVNAIVALRRWVAFGGVGATGMVTCGRSVARELDSFGVVGTELGGCWYGVLARARVVVGECARECS